MENQLFDETNGLWYELKDGYYDPCLTVSEEEKQPIGLWGRQHKQYLKEQHRPIIYNSLQLNGKLNAYLAHIDQQAQERYELLVKQMKQARGITEGLKAADPMSWVGRMNTIQSCVKDIINTETVFA